MTAQICAQIFGGFRYSPPCFNTNFVGSTKKINICLIFLTIYIFIPVSSCHRDPSTLLCPGAHNAVKIALVGVCG